MNQGMTNLRRIIWYGRRWLSSLARLEEKHMEPEKCLNLEDKCIVHPCCGMPKVVIVGAGCAGIAAANRLLSCGITDVVVLEACDRIGGRVMSCWLGDTLVELGLGNIGSPNITNPTYNFAVSMGELSFLIESRDVPAVFVTSEGRAIENYSTENLLFRRVLDEVSSLGNEKTSLLHYLDLKLQQELLNYPEHLRYDAERVLYGMANELRSEWGSDLESISAPLISVRKYIPGKSVRISQGNSSLILSMAKSIPFKNLKLQKEVTKIAWQAEPTNLARARVCTNDGDTYEADYVIMTLPIGVLKHRSTEIFSPPLPDSKITAFNSVGIGYFNKIYLEYEYPWWAGEFMIRLAWTPSEITRPGNWAVGIGGISSISRSVLCFLINGPEALMIEESSEEEIAMELTRLIRKLMKDCTIPFPHHIIVTRWGSNKYCRGSVTGLRLDSSEDHLMELSHPVPEEKNDITPVLLFAGDMTVPRYHGRLPAAWISGIREADRILELTKKFSGPPKPKDPPPPPACPS